jgi:NADH dehydrogenase
VWLRIGPEVFVVGDLAAAVSADSGRRIPGLAQAAIQMGRFAGEAIANDLRTRSAAAHKPFVYRDKGTMAVIGKSKAIAQIGRFEFGGFFAWLLWGGVHIAFLIGFRNRVQVLLSWFWSWFLNARDARLITGKAQIDVQTPLPVEFVRSNAENPPHEKTGA